MDDLRWWLTVCAAVAVKLVLSEVKGWVRAITTASSALFMAVVFTDPLIGFLGWNVDRYEAPVAGVLALFGENVVRRIMDMTASKTFLKDVISIWRGK